MPKNYVYRMDHDTGFAPHIANGICTLSGCKNSKNGKRKNIEESARKGSWIIGIGGINTHKPDRLIYIMQVDENLEYEKFKEKYPTESNYLKKALAGNNVLLSKRYYYFGDAAIELEGNLKNIIVTTQGCKCIANEDIDKLIALLIKRGYDRCDAYGRPNNPGLYQELSRNPECKSTGRK